MRLVRGNPQLAGLALIATMVVFTLLAVGINLSFGLPGNVSLGLPPTRDYTLRAAFTDANGLNRGASVLVAGNPIGQVTGVTAGGRQAVVAMRVTHQYAPLHKGTIARIRYSTLLAQKYVELSPAAGTPALPDGSTIPSDETITPVDFDQFLSTLDPVTRRQAQVLVQQLGGGLEGRGATLNLLLDELSGLSQESRPGLSTLNSHDADLSSIAANLAVASQRLAQSRQQLGDLVANTGQVSGTLAANDRSLDDLLVRLAHTSADFDQTLNGNEGNLHDTVTSLDPFLGQLNSNLGTTYPYLHNGQQTFRDSFNVLTPEVDGAIGQSDANGNYLRQTIVADSCFDSINSKPANPRTGQGCLLGVSGSGPAPPSNPAATSPPAAPATAPKAPGTPKGGGLIGGLLCPSQTPVLPPLPPVTPILCPTLIPCLPGQTPPPPPTPPTPTPTPTPSGCASLPNPTGQNGLPLPLPLPSAVSALLGMP